MIPKRRVRVISWLILIIDERDFLLLWRGAIENVGEAISIKTVMSCSEFNVLLLMVILAFAHHN